MMLEDAPTAEDRVLEANGVKVYVDGSSVDLLQGSEIDYVDTLMGAGFTVNNPNAVAACGCGSSFRTADDSGSAAGLRPLNSAPRRREGATARSRPPARTGGFVVSGRSRRHPARRLGADRARDPVRRVEDDPAGGVDRDASSAGASRSTARSGGGPRRPG